jgi:hypothetical protein
LSTKSYRRKPARSAIQALLPGVIEQLRVSQNRATVLGKAAFSFAATRQMKNFLPSCDLRVTSEAGGLRIFCLGCGHGPR